MEARRIITVAVLSAGLFARDAISQVHIPDLQAQFDHESNPVRKAKLLQKLGDAQFQEVHREQLQENYDAVEKIYESYRDNVKVALNGLKGSRPDAEKHSEGYRQLHIQLRKGLRDIDETILSAPQELRPRLESVRTGLVATDNDLIKLLFPRRRKSVSGKRGDGPEAEDPPAASAGKVEVVTEKQQTKQPGEIKAQDAGERAGPLRPPAELSEVAGERRGPLKAGPDPAPSSSPDFSNEPTAPSLPSEVEVVLQRRSGANEKKDYLSELEADKIRDAETSNQRIKLLLTFAEDRLKKFQYELAHPSASGRHSEMLIFLMNAYAGCVDDAAEYIDVGHEKQENVHAGIKEMLSKGKEFLGVLEQLSAKGAEREIYKETLDDAIEGTRDAMHDAEKAQKEIAPPPVRRPK